MGFIIIAKVISDKSLSLQWINFTVKFWQMATNGQRQPQAQSVFSARLRHRINNLDESVHLGCITYCPRRHLELLIESLNQWEVSQGVSSAGAGIRRHTTAAAVARIDPESVAMSERCQRVTYHWQHWEKNVMTTHDSWNRNRSFLEFDFNVTN